MSAVLAECLREILDVTASGRGQDEVAAAAREVVVDLWLDSLRDRTSGRFIGLSVDLGRACADVARQVAAQTDGMQRASSPKGAEIARCQARALMAASHTIRALLDGDARGRSQAGQLGRWQSGPE